MTDKILTNYNQFVINTSSPSARLENNFGAGYPCRPHFFGTNRRI